MLSKLVLVPGLCKFEYQMRESQYGQMEAVGCIERARRKTGTSFGRQPEVVATFGVQMPRPNKRGLGQSHGNYPKEAVSA
jgi:hypothetical protein